MFLKDSFLDWIFLGGLNLGLVGLLLFNSLKSENITKTSYFQAKDNNNNNKKKI